MPFEDTKVNRYSIGKESRPEAWSHNDFAVTMSRGLATTPHDHAVAVNRF